MKTIGLEFPVAKPEKAEKADKKSEKPEEKKAEGKS